MSSTDSRCAIVTGGGTGIGRAICLRLAADGLRVAVAFSRSAQGAEQTVQQVEKARGQAFSLRADISREEDVEALFAACNERFGGVDVVVNNAGIGHLGAVAEISMEEYDRFFGINARGTFMMCRAAARQVRDQGRIINISTGLTSSSAWGMALYVGSKLAVEGFTKTLAHELGPRGIAVNTISPGMTDTPMLEGGDATALREYGAKQAAMKRVGQAEDIADLVAALVSEDGRWVTGQNIHVDGGTIIR